MKGARWKLGSGENAAMRYPFALCDCRVITVLGRHIKKRKSKHLFCKLEKVFQNMCLLVSVLSLLSVI